MWGILTDLTSHTPYSSQILSAEPEITFFKCVFRRHTPFGLCSEKVYFDQPMASVNTLNIPHHIDLLTDLTLQIELPALQATFTRDKIQSLKHLLRDHETLSAYANHPDELLRHLQTKSDVYVYDSTVHVYEPEIWHAQVIQYLHDHVWPHALFHEPQVQVFDHVMMSFDVLENMIYLLARTTPLTCIMTFDQTGDESWHNLTQDHELTPHAFILHTNSYHSMHDIQLPSFAHEAIDDLLQHIVSMINTQAIVHEELFTHSQHLTWRENYKLSPTVASYVYKSSHGNVLNVWLLYVFEYLAFDETVWMQTLQDHGVLMQMDLPLAILAWKTLKIHIEYIMHDVSYLLNDLLSYEDFYSVQCNALYATMIFQRHVLPTVQEIFDWIDQFLIHWTLKDFASSIQHHIMTDIHTWQAIKTILREIYACFAQFLNLKVSLFITPMIEQVMQEAWYTLSLTARQQMQFYVNIEQSFYQLYEHFYAILIQRVASYVHEYPFQLWQNLMNQHAHEIYQLNPQPRFTGQSYVNTNCESRYYGTIEAPLLTPTLSPYSDPYGIPSAYLHMTHHESANLSLLNTSFVPLPETLHACDYVHIRHDQFHVKILSLIALQPLTWHDLLNESTDSSNILSAWFNRQRQFVQQYEYRLQMPNIERVARRMHKRDYEALWENYSLYDLISSRIQSESWTMIADIWSNMNLPLFVNHEPAAWEHHVRQYQTQHQLSDENKQILWHQIMDILTRDQQPRVAWTRHVGHFILSSVELLQGTEVLETITSEVLESHMYTHIPDAQARGYNQMIGQTDTLTHWRANVIPAQTLFLRLPFFFTRHICQAFPLLSIAQDSLSLRVRWRPLSDLIISENDAQWIVEPSIKAQIILNGAMIDLSEREYMLNHLLEYHVQMWHVNHVTPLNCTPHNPMLWSVWMARLNDHIHREQWQFHYLTIQEKQWSNYTVQSYHDLTAWRTQQKQLIDQFQPVAINTFIRDHDEEPWIFMAWRAREVPPTDLSLTLGRRVLMAHDHALNIPIFNARYLALFLHGMNLPNTLYYVEGMNDQTLIALYENLPMIELRQRYHWVCLADTIRAELNHETLTPEQSRIRSHVQMQADRQIIISDDKARWYGLWLNHDSLEAIMHYWSKCHDYHSIFYESWLKVQHHAWQILPTVNQPPIKFVVHKSVLNNMMLSTQDQIFTPEVHNNYWITHQISFARSLASGMILYNWALYPLSALCSGYLHVDESALQVQFTPIKNAQIFQHASCWNHLRVCLEHYRLMWHA